MTLLDFARGPALQGAAFIFVVGMVWRALGLLLLHRNTPLSRNRDNHLARHGFRTVLSRFIPAPVFERRVSFQYVAGWIWHLGFFVVLLWLLGRRIVNPVLRYISTFNDYSSLVVTMLPFITGFLAFAHYGFAYETMLALHILSISLLLVWFPFSKLIHVITLLPSRYILGVKFWRRGVQA